MSLGTLIRLGLALWLFAEALVFAVVAKLIGFPEALLFGFLTSLLGLMLLKRTGASAMGKLRAALNGRAMVEAKGRVMDDALAGLGALALLVPGFLSDVVGLVLAIPAARDRVAAWVVRSRLAGTFGKKGQGSRSEPQTIDLEPGDWTRSGSTPGPATKYGP